MRLIISLLGTVFAVALLLLGIFVYILNDPAKLKPELEALASEYAEAEVAINGDISWQFGVPFRLQASDISVTRSPDEYRVGKLALELDLQAIWQDVEQWRVQGLELIQVAIRQPTSNTDIAHLRVTDFTFGEPADFEIAFSHLSNADEPVHKSTGEAGATTVPEPITAEIAGKLIYSPASGELTQSLSLRETTVNSPLGSGICELDARERGDSGAQVEVDPDALLPLDLLNEIHLVGECSLTSITIDAETFTDGVLNVSNVNGVLTGFLELRDFFAGTLTADMEVQLEETPVQWRITPDLSGIDTQRYLEWSDRSYQWLALVNATGALQMQGNTRQALENSVTGNLTFEANDGEINVARLKQQLSRLAVFTGDVEKMSKRPDLWNYTAMNGNLQIEGKNLAMTFLLDNLSAQATGAYNLLTDRIDMRGTVTLSEPSPDSPFVPNPILQDTPIPGRCSGPTAEISCKLDGDATKALIAGALKQGGDTGLRRKLEQKIDEKVPEEYRETARGLLDLLGRALEEGD